MKIDFSYHENSHKNKMLEIRKNSQKEKFMGAIFRGEIFRWENFPGGNIQEGILLRAFFLEPSFKYLGRVGFGKSNRSHFH